VAVIAVFAATLACVGGNVLSIQTRLNQRPIIWQVGRLYVSAELTVNPGCAPLAQTCWVQRPIGRPRYLSTWVYLAAPPSEPWHLSKWHMLVVPVGRDGG
jgi:hypothetical protein